MSTAKGKDRYCISAAVLVSKLMSPSDINNGTNPRHQSMARDYCRPAFRAIELDRVISRIFCVRKAEGPTGLGLLEAFFHDG